MSNLLTASGIGFAYGLQPVLHDVAVSLEAGQVVVLLGPNGSGKSTLVKILLGHLRASGSIAWEGKELHSWKRRELARRVAYLPQSPAWEADQLVADVLRLGRVPYWGPFGTESTRDVQVVRQTAELLELTGLMNRRLDELSGGQRQRVFLGRALVQEPRAMLLDEPNTFLDLRYQVEMGRLLRTLAREHSIGVLMASHDLNLAGMFADRLMLLSQGRIVASGPANEVFNAELLSRVYGIEMERIDRANSKTPVVLPSLQE